MLFIKLIFCSYCLLIREKLDTKLVFNVGKIQFPKERSLRIGEKDHLSKITSPSLTENKINCVASEQILRFVPSKKAKNSFVQVILLNKCFWSAGLDMQTTNATKCKMIYTVPIRIPSCMSLIFYFVVFFVCVQPRRLKSFVY